MNVSSLNHLEQFCRGQGSEPFSNLSQARLYIKGFRNVVEVLFQKATNEIAALTMNEAAEAKVRLEDADLEAAKVYNELHSELFSCNVKMRSRVKDSYLVTKLFFRTVAFVMGATAFTFSYLSDVKNRVTDLSIVTLPLRTRYLQKLSPAYGTVAVTTHIVLSLFGVLRAFQQLFLEYTHDQRLQGFAPIKSIARIIWERQPTYSKSLRKVSDQFTTDAQIGTFTRMEFAMKWGLQGVSNSERPRLELGTDGWKPAFEYDLTKHAIVINPELRYSNSRFNQFDIEASLLHEITKFKNRYHNGFTKLALESTKVAMALFATWPVFLTGFALSELAELNLNWREELKGDWFVLSKLKDQKRVKDWIQSLNWQGADRRMHSLLEAIQPYASWPSWTSPSLNLRKYLIS
jgi:hypothetical protein